MSRFAPKTIHAHHPLRIEDFYNLDVALDRGDQQVVCLMNPLDKRDLYTWDVNVTGEMFLDKLEDDEWVTYFGDWKIVADSRIKQGVIVGICGTRIVFMEKTL